MPAKRTMRFLAMRSGTRLLCAARSWALVGFQGVGNVRFIIRPQPPFPLGRDKRTGHNAPLIESAGKAAGGDDDAYPAHAARPGLALAMDRHGAGPDIVPDPGGGRTRSPSHRHIRESL